MFDYQEISLYTGKDTPNLAYLNQVYSKQGWEWYRLDYGIQPIRIGYSSGRKELIVKGSIPYYGQGHNATHSPEALRQNWGYIGDILGLNLFGASVMAFEFGKIVEAPHKPFLVLEHHTRLPGFETQLHCSKSGKIKGVYFHSSTLKVKLYDPIANYRSKRLSKSAYTDYLGLVSGKNYLRVENHYKKPERYFKERILLTDFFNPVFQQICKTDLMETYNRITKTKAIALPDDKAKLSTANIVLAAFQDLALQSGVNAEEMINATLARIPSDVLGKEDRKARKRQLGKMFSEISATGQNLYDLTEPLRQKLYGVEENIRVL